MNKAALPGAEIAHNSLSAQCEDNIDPAVKLFKLFKFLAEGYTAAWWLSHASHQEGWLKSWLGHFYVEFESSLANSTLVHTALCEFSADTPTSFHHPKNMHAELISTKTDPRSECVHGQ